MAQDRTFMRLAFDCPHCGYTDTIKRIDTNPLDSLIWNDAATRGWFHKCKSCKGLMYNQNGIVHADYDK